MRLAKLVEFCEQLNSFDSLLKGLLKENEENKRKLTELQVLIVRLLDDSLEEISERGNHVD